MFSSLAWSLRRGVSKQQPRKLALFQARGRGARPGFQPCFEALEDRLVLAAPTVTTPTSSAITATTAILGGNVTSDGGAAITRRGIVYSPTNLQPAPQIGLPNVIEVDAASAGTGIFTVNVGGLSPLAPYSFRAFATNSDGTTYTNIPAATFATLPGSLQMPADTVQFSGPTDYKNLAQLFLFQPYEGLVNPANPTVPVPTIPDKIVTFTNNTDHTVFPILVDTNATVDTEALKNGVTQALYDPLDPIYNEYRGYIGYKNGDGSFVGLLPGTSITVKVPLVFWDGARIFIGTDPTYMGMAESTAQVGQTAISPNPFQYYAKNKDGSDTLHAVLPSGPVTGAPDGTTGVVMWYRQGKDSKDPNEPIGPANDAPAQLAEFTIRDTVLNKINPNIDALFPFNGETHPLINYDVSYVDNMVLPVALQALDVPIPITNPPAPDRFTTPYPGGRIPYGWVGAAQTVDQFKAGIEMFLETNPTNPDGTLKTNVNGLGTYFGLVDPDHPELGYNGWTQYNYAVQNFGFPAFPNGVPLTKVPSAQDALSDTPLNNVSSSYDLHSNSYMLTSGGEGPKGVDGGAGGTAAGTNAIAFTQGTIDGNQTKLRDLAVGMVVGSSTSGYTVPPNTKVTGITYQTPGDSSTPIVGVTTDGPVPQTPNGASGVVFTFLRPVRDYVSTSLVNLWYTWAKYYVEHLPPGTVVPPNGLDGHSVQDANKPAPRNNVIELSSVTGLAPGMKVTGPGISTNPVDGPTTIISIDTATNRISVSQGVIPDSTGTYNFFLPTVDASDPNHTIQGLNDPTLEYLQSFNPSPTTSVPDVLRYAQNAYQLLSFMSQVPGDSKRTDPLSVQVMHNVIGGNVTKPTNLDGLHKIEVAFRDMVKSLLRGVNDFTKNDGVQNNPANWYPDPSTGTGGQTFNVFNLDPFVWFVHKQMGLSGYGFSLDDDSADIGANFATQLGISIGGLNGLPNQVEWLIQAPYGPVSGNATVLSLTNPQPPLQPNNKYEIAGLPENVWYSVTPLDVPNATPAALVTAPQGVSPGTYLLQPGFNAQGAFSYDLGNDTQPPTNTVPPLIPPLQVGSTAQFTFYAVGTPNTGVLTLGPGQTRRVSPYTNTLDVTIPSGSTLKVETDIGTLTSYTQQVQQLTRVDNITRGLIPVMPSPFTIVDGALFAGRVAIADGVLAGTGTVGTGVPNTKTSVDVMGPLAGYDHTNYLNQDIHIKATKGGFLAPGTPNNLEDPVAGGTPGKLTIDGDVSFYGATFVAYAKGAAKQGSDYSWLSSEGSVNLGNSSLNLSLLGYTPQVGDSLTILTADDAITGKFSQGNSITVNGFRFNITYNENSVVLTYAPAAPALLKAAPPAQDPLHEFVETLYRDVVKHPPRQADLDRWVGILQSGGSRSSVALAIVTSPAHLRKHPDLVSFVKSLYHNVLGKRATPQKVAAWVAVAEATGADLVALAEAFLKSAAARKELRERFNEAVMS